MRKHLIYGVFVLAVVGISGLLYYVISSDAEQSNSHIIQPDLNSAPYSPNNALESVQNEEAQTSVKIEQPEDLPVEQEPQLQSDTVDGNPTILTKKKVILEDGKEIMVFENVPDSWSTKTEVHFDKEGKPHVKHR